MNFEIKKTGIWQAMRWEKVFKYARVLKILCLVLLAVLVCWCLFGYFGLGKWLADFKNSMAWAAVLLCLAIIFGEGRMFFEKKLKNPTLKYSLKQALQNPDEFNFADFLDFYAAKICQKAIAMAKRHSSAQLKDILLYCLAIAKPKEIIFAFQRAELDLRALRNFVQGEFAKPKEEKDIGFEKIIIEAANQAQQNNRPRIMPGDILSAFACLDPVLEKFLIEFDFRKEDIKNLVNWFYKIQRKREQSSCWWNYENLLQKGSLGKDFSAGYTITLDKVSPDLRDKISRNVFREVVGHAEEVKQVERILEKEQMKNVLLVGEPGTGRGSVIEALAQRAFLGTSAPSVNYKRILQLDVSGLISQVQSQEQAATLLEKCFSEVIQAKNVILAINDFHNYVAQNSQPGMINISGIMARYLLLPSFQVIAVTTFEGFHTYIERNASFRNLFEKVEVGEISEADTLILMEQHVPLFEFKHKRYIGFRALKEILKMSSRYLAQTPFPEKAIRLLDEALVYLKMYTKDHVLGPKHIQKVVSEKTKIPLEMLEGKEKQILLNLEDLIHTRLINQEEAVKEVAGALRRARSEVNLKSGPIGSFLFLGPTGVGKTETAKAIAAVYFGKEQSMVRFDMSEFQAIEDIKRLIGTSQENGLLTTKVKETPFCLLLLDELEKAHPNVLNLFLQVLDEGWLTDGLGRKVDFKNTIVIATSNAAAEIIMEDVKLGRDLAQTKEHVFNYIFQQRILRPEFINRFDAVILFKPLAKEELLQIAGLMLAKLAKNLLDKGIKLEITPELKQKVTELSFNPAFGAREMKRIMQDKVENALAKALLLGELKRGCKVAIDPMNFSLKIT